MEIRQMQGNEALLERGKTAFLSSRRTPERLLPAVAEWIVSLSREEDCVMCGNQSPVERTVFDMLLQNEVPAVLVLAETMPEVWRDDIKAALDAGRLLVITHCDAGVHHVSTRSAFDRNLLMLSLADRIVVGFCDKGGNLERALAGFDNITFLLSSVHDDAEAYVIPVGQRGGRRPGDNTMNIDDWRRAIKVSDGMICLCFNGYKKDKYLKISHLSDVGSVGDVGRQICLGRTELSSFYDLLCIVLRRIEEENAVDEEMTVCSASGDVSFVMEHEGNDGILRMTQTKDLRSMGMRRQGIALHKRDIVPFMDILSEAKEHFSVE